MVTIYEKIVRDTRTGYEEIFRTTKREYLPPHCVLVKELGSFTFGVEEPKPEEPVKKKSEKLANTAAGCMLVTIGVVVFMLLIVVLSIFAG